MARCLHYADGQSTIRPAMEAQHTIDIDAVMPCGATLPLGTFSCGRLAAAAIANVAPEVGDEYTGFRVRSRHVVAPRVYRLPVTPRALADSPL